MSVIIRTEPTLREKLDARAKELIEIELKRWPTRTQTAESLGISLRQLFYNIRKLHIKDPRRRPRTVHFPGGDFKFHEERE